MISEQFKTQLEHAVDSRSVGVGVWLCRRTRGGITRLWHRRAVVLTTTGRRSGLPRTVLVQAFQDGDDLLVVAANSGLPRPPSWYFNLLAEPRVLGEIDGRRMQLRAELLGEAEAATAWHEVVLTTAPDYEKYERRISRIPPIFRLRLDPVIPEGPAGVWRQPEIGGAAHSLRRATGRAPLMETSWGR